MQACRQAGGQVGYGSASRPLTVMNEEMEAISPHTSRQRRIIPLNYTHEEDKVVEGIGGGVKL